MEHIKEQIAIKLDTMYQDCTTFHDLLGIRSQADNYIEKGLHKMRESGVFYEDEISEIKEFATDVNFKKYKEYNTIITNNLRTNFVF